MRLVVSMQALLWFGSRNKSTCPLSYLSKFFVCILSLFLIQSVTVNRLFPRSTSSSPASKALFCFLCVLPHVSLWQRAWQRTCGGCGVFDVYHVSLLHVESWKVTGEARAGVTALGNGTKDEATAVGCPLFLDMAIVCFILESDDIRWYQYIWVYLHSGHECLKMVGFAEGLWRAKANGQVPALKISFTQPWWGQLSGSVVGVGDSSATEYKHRLKSVQMLNCWVSLCCGLKFFAKLGFEVVFCSPKKWSTTFLFDN